MCETLNPERCACPTGGVGARASSAPSWSAPVARDSQPRSCGPGTPQCIGRLCFVSIYTRQIVFCICREPILSILGRSCSVSIDNPFYLYTGRHRLREIRTLEAAGLALSRLRTYKAPAVCFHGESTRTTAYAWCWLSSHPRLACPACNNHADHLSLS
jgi:hypothetical protein